MKIVISNALLIMLASMLTGCATPADVMKEPPKFTFDTSASPVEIRKCLADAHTGEYVVTPYKDGWVVAKNLEGFMGPQDVIWLVQAEPIDGGSHVVVHYMNFLKAHYRNDAEPCIEKYRSQPVKK